MKKGWIVVVAMFLSLSATAQSGATNPPAGASTANADVAPPPPLLARGDIVVASLTGPLDAGKAKVGDLASV